MVMVGRTNSVSPLNRNSQAFFSLLLFLRIALVFLVASLFFFFYRLFLYTQRLSNGVKIVKQYNLSLLICARGSILRGYFSWRVNTSLKASAFIYCIRWAHMTSHKRMITEFRSFSFGFYIIHDIWSFLDNTSLFEIGAWNFWYFNIVI